MKKALSVLLAATMAFSLAACGGSSAPATTAAPAAPAETTAAAAAETKAEETKADAAATEAATEAAAAATGEGKKIGVAMPTQSSERWINDGANMKKQLEEKGYEVDLQYAEDDV